MGLTEQQQEIIKIYETTNKNIRVCAGAGAGKSFILKELAKRTPKDRRQLFMAFNKSIAEELKGKLPETAECVTYHSKGFRLLLKFFNFKPNIDENKCFKLILKHFNLIDVSEERKGQFIYAFNLQTIWDQLRTKLTPTDQFKESIKDICNEKEIDYDERMVEDLLLIKDLWIKEAKKHLNSKSDFGLDFTDMIYLPVMMIDPLRFPKYDVVFVDEQQDSNPLQKQFILNCMKRNGRFVVCGDEKQCQPAGTKILLSDGNQKNIEDIQVGDCVCCYDSYKGYYRGLSLNSDYRERVKKYRVLEKSERIVDEILEVTLKNGMKSRYTYEHTCYAQFDREKSDNTYILYLMENNEGMYRIGITKLFNNASCNSFGLKFRMRLENCKRGWILNIFNSKIEALKEEQFCSYKFSIPQLVFCVERASGKRDSFFNDQDIRDIYKKLGSLEQNARECLNYWGKDFDKPFSINGDDKRIARDHCFEIAACNLFPKYMNMIYFDKNNKRKSGKYSNIFIKNLSPISEIRRIKEQQKVYGLLIENYHNYVADNILTHNCIYHFQSSDIDVFSSFGEIKNTINLPLSITFRCAKNIVNEANKIFPGGLQTLPTANEGIVRKGTLSEAQSGDFVLCRNNLPLIQAFIKFLSEGKKCYILGTDYGDQIAKLLEDCTSLGSLEEKLREKREKLQEKGYNNNQIKNNPSYIALEEKIKIIKLLYEKFRTFDNLKSQIKEIFKENGKGIVLSTIHKSKGLESDKVFFLNENLIPSEHATTEKALYAEKCLKFVAITRARKELIYCVI